MREVTNNDIQIVINSLEEFFQHIARTGQFNLQEFINFMESKFAQAGYRTPPPQLNSKHNILVTHDSGVGDFVAMTGLIREIRRVYPNAHITLVVFAPAFNLAESCPYVDEIIVNTRRFDEANFLDNYKSNIDMAKQILIRRYDICYTFPRALNSLLMMYMSGAKTRVTYSADDNFQYELYKNLLNLATHNAPIFKYGTNIADTAFALLDEVLH